MRSRFLIAACIALFALSFDAAPRRRAASKPVVDVTTPAGWLSHYARPLLATELVPYSYDLEPLRNMIGDSVVVGLGDGTHGTREFFTVKLRVIDFLVREMDFDVVSFEAPFPLLNRINGYVQGGEGDARALVGRMIDSGGYTFWEVEEIVQVVEWMRTYNLTRGNRPAIEIAGTDYYQETAAAADVVSYLRGVDPSAADSAAQKYACLDISCDSASKSVSVHDALAAREAELVERTSFRAYHDALQSARIVMQRFNRTRDWSMANNVEWLRTHRGTSGKVIFWAHNEHVTKGESPWAFDITAGYRLREALGDDYFALATLTGSGSFLQWQPPPKGSTRPRAVTSSFPAVQNHAYETFFRQHGAPILLIPFGENVPPWLAGPAHYNTSTVAGPYRGLVASLPAKFDAAIYIETTTPLTPLPPPPPQAVAPLTRL